MLISEIASLFSDYELQKIHFNNLKNDFKNYLSLYKNSLKLLKHPLGFYYCKLFTINEIEEYRLHYWISNSHKQDNDLMIHNHNFHLTSILLNGCIVNNNFDVFEDYEKNGFLYETIYINQYSKLKLISANVNCKLQNTQIYSKGNIYKLNEGQFHKSSIINGDVTITLLKTLRNTNFSPKVYSNCKFVSLNYNREFSNDFDKNKLIYEIIEIL